MLPIVHRVNTLKRLKETPMEFGVEMDIHAYGQELVVHHDPFQDAICFTKWLDHFNHKLVVLNLKEEGIEYKVHEIMKDHNIDNYFMLDIPPAALIRFIRTTGERRVAVRASYYEPIDTALKLSGKADWVFVDLFEDKFPLSCEEYTKLKNAGFKVCLVSPELWNRPVERLKAIQTELLSSNIIPDAVCTKYPNLWEKQPCP